ncbi:MAG: succinylglutamate desuccinylase/aspartoacylase family protein [Pseudomonadota bacterium]
MRPTPVEIEAPDISAYCDGNTGIPYVRTLESGRAGPHAVITSLVHGNELCGAWALTRLLQCEDIRPKSGRLSLVFANTEAYQRFDPDQPRATRYLDEDLNRVWDLSTLDGPRQSRELRRARELRPLIEGADWLLDLHSMQLESPPLLLSGLGEKGRKLAAAMGYPALVVADSGHRTGSRMRDFGAFADPASDRTAMLVECGQHWARDSVDVAIATCRRFLEAIDMVDPASLDQFCPAPELSPQRAVDVTDAITVGDGPFRFTGSFQGLEVISEAGTVIAYDGATPIRTPYDDCVLIMPSRRLVSGLTAVRLGRFADQ